MILEVTDVEREFLLGILQERLGELKQEERHSRVSSFTDELKTERAVRSRSDRKAGSTDLVSDCGQRAQTYRIQISRRCRIPDARTHDREI